MNILVFVIEDTYIGGAESVLHLLTDSYLKKGNQVYVLFFRPKKYGHWEKSGNPNIHLYYGGGLSTFISNIKKIRSIHFDYSYSSLVDLTGMLGILRRLRILHFSKMIGRESTSIFERYKGIGLARKKLMYLFGYPAVDSLVCQTEYMKRQLIANLPWIEKKCNVIVVPNPVDEQMMELKGNDVTELSTIQKCQPYIVTAGRFIPEKGYDILIDAFNRIRKSYPELKLVILGDGELRPYLVDKVSKYALNDKVYMPGFKQNVFPWFRHAKLCVISSRVEGFPNVLLQMMSQNSKVVSTLCAGDIENIEGIYTCQPNNVDELVAAMKKSLVDDEEMKNIDLFNIELSKRSIESFINTIEESLI